MVRQNENTLRPWVSIDSVRLVPYPNQTFSVAYKVVNFGAMPAKKLEVGSFFSRQRFQGGQFELEESSMFVHFAMYPGAERWITTSERIPLRSISGENRYCYLGLHYVNMSETNEYEFYKAWSL